MKRLIAAWLFTCVVAGCETCKDQIREPGVAAQAIRSAHTVESYLVASRWTPRKHGPGYVGGYAIQSRGPDLTSEQVRLLSRLLEQPCAQTYPADLLCSFAPRFAVRFRGSCAKLDLLYCPGCHQSVFTLAENSGPMEIPPYSLCAVESLEGLFFGLYPTERKVANSAFHAPVAAVGRR